MHQKKYAANKFLFVFIIPIITSILLIKPASASTTPASSFGSNFGFSTGETLLGLDIATLNKRLDEFVSMHVGWIRFDIDWNHIQGINSSTYDWSRIDQFVNAANAHGIKLLAVVDYTPAWARPSTCNTSDRCPPADPAQFAAFANLAARRYGKNGMKWEIWNEPNLKGYWLPAADPEGYAALLKVTYPAIKAGQPGAGILLGGLGPAATENGDIAPVTFLSDLYSDGARLYFDAVGFHPYSFPADPTNYQIWNAWSQMADTPSNLRSVMIANNDGPKRIWMTEYGAPTEGPGNIASQGHLLNYTGRPDHVTEALQSEMLTEAIQTRATLSWAGPLFWYSNKDLGTSITTNEDSFGMLRYDSTPKLAYTTLSTLLQ